jgi:hypothetical protein
VSDIERDAQELGTTIEPNPSAAYGRLQRRLPHPGLRLLGGWRVAGALVASAVAMATVSLVLAGAVASWGPLGAGHPLGTAQRSTGSATAVNALGNPQRGGSGGAPVGSNNGGGTAATPIPTSGQASVSPASTPRTVPGPRTPAPTLAPTSGATITITNQSSGEIHVSRGARVHVTLTGQPPYRWSVPTSSDTRVLTPVSSSTDANGDATGDFIASASGQSTISATDSPVCSPQCGAPTRLWSVTITVS